MVEILNRKESKDILFYFLFCQGQNQPETRAFGSQCSSTCNPLDEVTIKYRSMYAMCIISTEMSWANVLEKEGNQFNRDRSHFLRILGFRLKLDVALELMNFVL